jgi:hypothetical protein
MQGMKSLAAGLGARSAQRFPLYLVSISERLQRFAVLAHFRQSAH